MILRGPAGHKDRYIAAVRAGLRRTVPAVTAPAIRQRLAQRKIGVPTAFVGQRNWRAEQCRPDGRQGGGKAGEIRIPLGGQLLAAVGELQLPGRQVFVGGVLLGTMTVANVLGKIEGGIEFDTDPSEPGKVLLTFDPRGKLVEVKQGATTFFTLAFPSN